MQNGNNKVDLMMKHAPERVRSSDTVPIFGRSKTLVSEIVFPKENNKSQKGSTLHPYQTPGEDTSMICVYLCLFMDTKISLYEEFGLRKYTPFRGTLLSNYMYIHFRTKRGLLCILNEFGHIISIWEKYENI